MSKFCGEFPKDFIKLLGGFLAAKSDQDWWSYEQTCWYQVEEFKKYGLYSGEIYKWKDQFFQVIYMKFPEPLFNFGLGSNKPKPDINEGMAIRRVIDELEIFTIRSKFQC